MKSSKAPARPVKKKEPLKKSAGFDLFSEKVLMAAYLLILLVAFVNIYSYIFDEKLDMNGDNYGYYTLGKALADGKGYVATWDVNKSPHNFYTPGYPVIVGTVITIAGSATNNVKIANGILFFASLLLFFFIFLKLTKNIHLAFITTVIIMLNAHLLRYSTIMMSEIPFTFFSTLVLLLFISTDFTKPVFRNYKFLIMVVCLASVYYIRTTGLALVGGLILALLVKRHWKYLLVMITGFIVMAAPWYIRGKQLGGNAYITVLFTKNPYRPELGQMGIVDFFTRFYNNFQRYVTKELPNGIFSNFKVNYEEGYPAINWLFGILLILAIAWGIYKLRNHRSLILFYFFGTFGIILLWPEVWFGVRFILPILPLLIFLAMYGIFSAASGLLDRMGIKNEKVIPVILSFAFLLSIPLFKSELELQHENAKLNYPPNYLNYFEVGRWVSKNTSPDDLVCCRKADIFHIYSQGYTTNFLYTLDTEEQIDYFKESGTDYVVLDQLGYAQTGRYLYPAIQRYPEKFIPVYVSQKPETYLLKFEPDRGYTGEWKDDKKEGNGTFVYENGERYVGQWKNDLRNGPGRLYYPDGQWIEGRWVNDLMNGPATLWAKDSTIVERRVYNNNNIVSRN